MTDPLTSASSQTSPPPATQELYLYPEYEEAGSTTTEPLFPAVEALLQKYLPDPGQKSILDAGCGNGTFCRRLLERGFETYGIDLSESGISLARKSIPDGHFEKASVYDSYRDLFQQTFDAIVSMEVVEHLYDPRLFVSRVKESLAPGGLFVVTTPYYGYLKNLVIALTGRFDRHFTPLWDGGHIKLWSRSTLSQLLSEAGFEILEFRGVGRLPYLWRNQVFAVRKPLAAPADSPARNSHG